MPRHLLEDFLPSLGETVKARLSLPGRLNNSVLDDCLDREGSACSGPITPGFPNPPFTSHRPRQSARVSPDLIQTSPIRLRKIKRVTCVVGAHRAPQNGEVVTRWGVVNRAVVGAARPVACISNRTVPPKPLMPLTSATLSHCGPPFGLSLDAKPIPT